MFLKVTLQKESPNQSLPKVSSEAAVLDVLQNCFLEISQCFQELRWSLFLIKLQAYFNTCVFLWILQNKISGGICWSSLLNQKQCGMVSTKKGRSCHSTCYLNTLLVETISTRVYRLTCRNQKLVQNKPLQQRLFDLVLGFWQSFFFDILIANMNGGSDSYKACHFLRDCNKNFQIHICKLL